MKYQDIFPFTLKILLTGLFLCFSNTTLRAEGQPEAQEFLGEWHSAQDESFQFSIEKKGPDFEIINRAKTRNTLQFNEGHFYYDDPDYRRHLRLQKDRDYLELTFEGLVPETIKLLEDDAASRKKDSLGPNRVLYIRYRQDLLPEEVRFYQGLWYCPDNPLAFTMTQTAHGMEHRFINKSLTVSSYAAKVEDIKPALAYIRGRELRVAYSYIQPYTFTPKPDGTLVMTQGENTWHFVKAGEIRPKAEEYFGTWKSEKISIKIMEQKNRNKDLSLFLGDVSQLSITVEGFKPEPLSLTGWWDQGFLFCTIPGDFVFPRLRLTDDKTGIYFAFYSETLKNEVPPDLLFKKILTEFVEK